jgi:hypothetical protein
MTRLRRWSVLAALVLTAGLVSCRGGQEPAPADQKGQDAPAEKWLLDREVMVSAAPAPVPAFKYRLYPLSTERKDGNAVPMYLRFAHERSDARKKELREKPAEWNKLPLDKLPLDDAKKFLAGYEYNLKQLELGARRKTADWSYSLDAGDPIGLLLPDLQEMRMQAPVLVLKARVETAEGRYADAVRTLETGFSFSQQVGGDGPFLIASLVAIACAGQFADATLEVEERPDAPNLYWPLIDLRKANEFEQSVVELQFPDMADLDRERTPEQWDAALARVRKEVERILGMEMEGGGNVKRPPPGSRAGDPADKSPDLPAARKYLTDVVKLPAKRVEAMPPAQVLLLYISHYYHEVRDEVFQSGYLPYAQARPLIEAARKRVKSDTDTEAGRLAGYFLPAVEKVFLRQMGLERKLAAQRAIEALRMHAARTGQLPDKLDEVKVVPVPNDPGTDKPFEYQRDGATATLTSRIPGETQETTGLRYKVTLRK